jgi:hypothetical protein
MARARELLRREFSFLGGRSDASNASANLKLPAKARAKGMRGKLELKDGSLYCSFYFVGFSVIVR